MSNERIGIVGAGPGGLTSAMILAHRGCDVTVFERKDRVGGRNGPLYLGEYKFDTGPTFLMMKFILDQMFEEAGRDASNYLDFVRLDPLYRLKIGDREFFPAADPEGTRNEIEKHFPGNEAGFDRFLEKEDKRFRKLIPCLQKDYGSFLSYLAPVFLRAIPQMSLGRSVFGNLGRYFDDDDLKLCFSFQSKYLGMSPWDCPAFFTMLSYIEHSYGIHHVIGGLNEISQAMARVVKEDGGTIRLSTEVDELLIEDGRAEGVRLADGTEERFDRIVMNSDFGHSMCDMVPEGQLKRYTPEKLKKWKLSCSTFMLYLGVDKTYPDHPHHNVVFAEDYVKNVEEMMKEQVLPTDPSFYVQNASVTDPTLAPEDKSTIYVLVPVPNVRSGIDWDAEKDGYAEKTLDMLEQRAGFSDVRGHIEEQHVITPDDWAWDYNVYDGATFNLAHTTFQLLYFRPHNEFEEIDNCYLVGGGTHPGSGLPTIYESGRISSNLLCRDLGIPFEPPGNPLPD